MKHTKIARSLLALTLAGCLCIPTAAAAAGITSPAPSAEETDIDDGSKFESHFNTDAGVWKIDSSLDYVKDGILHITSNSTDTRTMTHEVTDSKAYELEVRIKVTDEGAEQGFKFETENHRMLVRVYKDSIQFGSQDGAVVVNDIKKDDFNTYKFVVKGSNAMLYVNGEYETSFKPAEWNRASGISLYVASFDSKNHASIEVDYIKYSHPHGTISIVSPFDGSDYVEGGKIMLKASVKEDIPYVDFYANGTYVGRALKENNYLLAWDKPRVGTYIISAGYGEQTAIESTVTVSPRTGTLATVADKAAVKLGDTVTLSLNRTPTNFKSATYIINGTEYKSDNGTLAYKTDILGKIFVSAKVMGTDGSVEYATPTSIVTSTDKIDAVKLQGSYIAEYTASEDSKVSASDGTYALDITHGKSDVTYLTAEGKKTYPIGLGKYSLQVDGGVCDLYYNGQFAFSFILPLTEKANGITASGVSDISLSGLNATLYKSTNSSGNTAPLPEIGREYAIEFSLDDPKDFTMILADGAYVADITAYNGSLVAVADQNGTYLDKGEDFVRVGSAATAQAYTDAENVTLCTMPSGRHAYRIAVSNGIAQLFIDNEWAASFRMPIVYSVPYIQTSGIEGVTLRETNELYIFKDSFDGSTELPSSEYFTADSALTAEYKDGAMILSPNTSASAEDVNGFIAEFDAADERWTKPDTISFDDGIMKISTQSSDATKTYSAETVASKDFELEAKLRVASQGKEVGFKFEYTNNRVMTYLRADNISIRSTETSVEFPINTSEWHTYKFVVTDHSNCEVFIDGVSKGTVKLQEKTHKAPLISAFIRANSGSEASLEIDYIHYKSNDPVPVPDSHTTKPVMLKAYAYTPTVSATVRVDSADKGNFYLAARYNNEYRNVLAGYNFTEGKWEIVQTHPTAKVLAENKADFPFGKDVKLEFIVGENTAALYVNGEREVSTDRVALTYYGNVGICTADITAKVTDFSYSGTGRVLPGTVSHTSSVSSPEIFEYVEGSVIYSVSSGSKALVSNDDGYTWTSDKPGKFSSNTIKLKNGTIVYLTRKAVDDGYVDYTYVSTDNGETFEGPFPVQDYVRNRITMNNKFTEGSDGRLYFASGESGHGVESEGGIRVFYSDDDGRTWTGSNLLGLDGKLYTEDDEARMDAANTGINCQESRVLEMPDGTLRLYARTDNGFLYYSVSTDRGETFSAKMYPSEFISVLSAFNIERDPYTGYYYCAWEYNNKNDDPKFQSPRTRTGLAVSYDGAKTWEYVGDIHETRSQIASTHANIGLKATKNAVYVTTVYRNDIDAKGNTLGVGYLVRVDKDTMKTTERFTKVHSLKPNNPEGSTAAAINAMLMISSDYSMFYAGGKLYAAEAPVKGYIPANIMASAIGANETVNGSSVTFKLLATETTFTVGEKTVKHGDKTVTLANAPIVKNGVIMLPVEILESVYTRELTSFANGSTLSYFDPYKIVSVNTLSAYLPTGRLSLTGALRNIPSTWAQSEVADADNIHIIPASLRYDYGEKITREEFCELIMQMLCTEYDVSNAKELLKLKGITFADNFTDTDNEAVIAANLLGILSGRGNGIFDPNSGITRQEAAVMLANTAKLMGIKAGTAPEFSDMDKAASWATDAIGTVTAIENSYAAKVMGGVGSGKFDPLGAYTREQSILTVYRLYMCA